MKIKKIMSRFYKDELKQIADYPPPQIQILKYTQKRLLSFFRNWDDLLGYLSIIFLILHYIISGRFFAVERLLMSASIIF